MDRLHHYHARPHVRQHCSSSEIGWCRWFGIFWNQGAHHRRASGHHSTARHPSSPTLLSSGSCPSRLDWSRIRYPSATSVEAPLHCEHRESPCCVELAESESQGLS